VPQRESNGGAIAVCVDVVFMPVAEVLCVLAVVRVKM
jgi:hypothetical protein